ncbi:DUF2283 domain-containing protein [Occultella kanbiaonis]|uniref:DUF2283 domain-containing protein n=1 Tax=Occultella kanbiaonis TaxID=2675754 RepID=UPI0013D5540D|nr:DUF2283 domain-containing protein [Occultella kanbiaonis]
MTTTLDFEVDAAHIYLAGEIAEGAVARTVVIGDARLAGMVNLDLDVDGRLVGIEVIGASEILPPTLLDSLQT